jgi:aspartyl-tRNA(Asn)/glutamyl-tRNA(Gln) amidotransferase subunit C
MSLTVLEIASVAYLARLRVNPNELKFFTGQLNSIVECVTQLQELDTSSVDTFTHGIDTYNVFRDDVRKPAVSREKALANAPERNEVGFLLPRVLD